VGGERDSGETERERERERGRVMVSVINLAITENIYDRYKRIILNNQSDR
jgi:hypothetical protein